MPSSDSLSTPRGVRPCLGRARKSRREEGCRFRRREGAAPWHHKTGGRTLPAERGRRGAAVCLHLPPPFQYTPQMPSMASSSTWISSRMRGSSVHVSVTIFSASIVFLLYRFFWHRV